MGIDDISDVFKEYNVPTCEVQYSQMSGYRVAIDTSNMVNKYMNKERVGYVQGLDLLFYDPDIRHLESQSVLYLLRAASGMMNNGITPIFVFDGKTPELKAMCAAVKRQEASLKKEKLFNDAWAKVLECRSNHVQIPYDVKKQVANNMKSKPSKQMMESLRQLLTDLGIPVMQAEYEADHVCSRLVEDGVAIAALSEDRDFLTHGCPRLIMKYGQGRGTLISLQDVLERTGFSFQQYRDLCIMLGNDYNTRMRGIGVKKCLDRIKSWKSLDYAPGDISHYNHHAVRHEFSSKSLDTLLDPQFTPRTDIYASNIMRAAAYLAELQIEYMIESIEAAKSQLSMVLVNGVAMSVPPEYFN